MQSIYDACHDISVIVNGIVGHKAWGAMVGHGSFITIEFGRHIYRYINDEYDEIGEWHFWIYMSSWRIEIDGIFAVGSEDPRDRMVDYVNTINGRLLRSFDVIPPALDVVLTFDQGLILKLFSIYSDHVDNDGAHHWMLYMPNNKVLVAGPGSKWVMENKD